MVNPTGYTALDLIGFTDKETYSSSANYVKNDLVHYSGNIWRCLIDDTSGIAPAEGVNWTLFIGEPTNLVERIIAPVETDPATSAYAVGRQIIYNDNLYEVITAITAGDALVAYEDDPTNANIKLADPVETQLLNEESARAAADLALQNALSHRNLLDNAWFTVNQRGQNSYASGASRYTVDRWQASSTESVVVNSDGSVTLSNVSASNAGLFQQYLESSLRDNLLGRAVTVSAIVDDVLYSNTFVMPSTVQSSYLVGSITIGDIVLKLRFSANQTLCFYFEHGANSSNSYTIRAVKLELGEVSTLAMDTAPNYAEELLKCQRYFFRKTISSGVPIGFGFSVNSTQARLAFTTPTIMRSTPSISPSTNDGTGIGIVYNGNSLSSTAISIHGMLENIVDILVSVASGLPGDNYPISARSNSNMYIDFSADL